MKLRVIKQYSPVEFLIKEEIGSFINERPNQAIKFLKQKNLNPETEEKGKEILDNIINITNGDGFTGLLTLFHVNDKLSLDDITELYQYLKNNKEFVKQLPKQIFQYSRYRDLRTDLDNIERKKRARELINRMPSFLKNQAKQLQGMELQRFYKIAEKFINLTEEQKNKYFEKIAGYRTIEDFIERLEAYIIAIESGDDINTVANNVKNIEGADVVYYNEEKNILIAYVYKFDTSVKLGCTTEWCITRDRHYWNDYKRSGKKYFFIWDFNYPSNDNNFLIGTAYDKKNPEGSQTHIKDGAQTNLDDVLNDKQLDYSIFDNFIKELQQKYLTSIEGQQGLMQALAGFIKGTDKEAIVNHIKASEFVTEHGNPDDVEQSINDKIDLGMSEDDLLNAFDIDRDAYDHVNGYNNNSSYYGYGQDHIDFDDEPNYMAGILSEENMTRVFELAKMFGLNKEQMETIKNDDGELRKFLDDYGFTDIVDEYNDKLNEAHQTARSNAATEMLETIPINIDDSTIDIHEMLEKIQKKDLTLNTFDEYIENADIDIDIEGIEEDVYSNLDYDNLNNEMASSLDNKIKELKNPNSEEYKRVKYHVEGVDLLNKLGFKRDDGHDGWVKNIPNGAKLVVENFRGPTDKMDEIGAGIRIIDPNRNDLLSGYIRLSNLAKYVNQYAIPFRK